MVHVMYVKSSYPTINNMYKIILYSHVSVIEVSVSPRNLSIPKGQLAAFECSAGNSRPRPRVTWYNDTEPIINGSDPRVFISKLSGNLFIRDVQGSDAGLYHCVVENAAGRVTSSKATLSLIAAGWHVIVCSHDIVCVCVCVCVCV